MVPILRVVRGKLAPATTQPGPVHPPEVLPNTQKVTALQRGDTGGQLALMEGSQLAKEGQGQCTARPSCPPSPGTHTCPCTAAARTEQQGRVKRTHAQDVRGILTRTHAVETSSRPVRAGQHLLPSFGGCGRKHASPGHRGMLRSVSKGSRERSDLMEVTPRSQQGRADAVPASTLGSRFLGVIITTSN